jgi:predicted transcriptional regulator
MNVPEENDEERQALHAAIEEGLQEADAGETVPVEDLFAEFERRK